MRAKRDYELIKYGKYNRHAIMQRAWAYMKQNKAFKWYSFAKALKDAWTDAHLKMDEYQSSLVQEEPIGKQRNVHEFGYAMLGWRYEHVG